MPQAWMARLRKIPKFEEAFARLTPEEQELLARIDGCSNPLPEGAERERVELEIARARAKFMGLELTDEQLEDKQRRLDLEALVLGRIEEWERPEAIAETPKRPRFNRSSLLLVCIVFFVAACATLLLPQWLANRIRATQPLPSLESAPATSAAFLPSTPPSAPIDEDSASYAARRAILESYETDLRGPELFSPDPTGKCLRAPPAPTGFGWSLSARGQIRVRWRPGGVGSCAEVESWVVEASGNEREAFGPVAQLPADRLWAEIPIPDGAGPVRVRVRGQIDRAGELVASPDSEVLQITGGEVLPPFDLKMEIEEVKTEIRGKKWVRLKVEWATHPSQQTIVSDFVVRVIAPEHPIRIELVQSSARELRFLAREEEPLAIEVRARGLAGESALSERLIYCPRELGPASVACRSVLRSG